MAVPLYNPGWPGPMEPPAHWNWVPANRLGDNFVVNAHPLSPFAAVQHDPDFDFFAQDLFGAFDLVAASCPQPDTPDATMPAAGPTGRAWCFTVNNPDLSIDITFPSSVKYAVWQLEIAPDTGTKHFQGYIEFSNSVSMAAVKKVFPTAHLERRKGTAAQARDYCMKEDSRADGDSGPWEHGVFVPSVGAGSRTDLEELKSAILEKRISRDEVMDNHLEAFAKYPRLVNELISRRAREDCDKVLALDLRPWQEPIIEMIMEIPHSREILWVYDPVGGAGKSTLAKHLVDVHGFFYTTGGKHADISYGYGSEPGIIFDFVRDAAEYVNYGIIEALKNGILYSPKYESGMKRFNTPHVIVFANFMAQSGKFSADRLVTIEVKTDYTYIVHK